MEKSPETRVVNLTPHALEIHAVDGKAINLPASGEIARVSVSYADAGTIVLFGLKVSVKSPVYGEVTGLPEPDCCPLCGTVGVEYRGDCEPYCEGCGMDVPAPRKFVVSGMVRSAISDRTDVFSPGELIRDENGQPIGCDGLKSF